ncbi:putative methyltransferase [Paeniglutamicibacter gangotriensis Lz1y]|uniref:Methyltransferase n=3 Tax=Paeniglutamicibacter gangotriensis TaxID=254787 RepID=M7NEQ7_9MICC|nr:putative methyltransferase [Paeniglutamicibacter gangotriensis Lz1y]KAA0979967.1 site-specific DNA-methyltransferase [Paeniglutamicibacter gangotriensis]
MPQVSPLDSQLSATHDTFVAERPSGADEDVHMVVSIVDHIIERCSKPGDLVFDPFAGFGTTLIRAIALGREALGIELLPERVDYLHERVPNAHIIEGDSRELLKLVRGPEAPLPDAAIKLIVASPPFMTAENHEPDPLTAYEKNDGDYDRYLSELSLIAAQCARVIAPDGFVVWNLADIHHMDLTTYLIRDCKRALGRHLTLVGETEILWDKYPHDLIADALLVFQRPAVEHR